MRIQKRFIVSVAIALALSLIAIPHRSSEASIAGLNPCTPVAVEMIDTIDSANARPGDFFRFQSINAVTAGAGIVIPTHTVGYGVVSVASAAARNGVSGTLVLEPRYFVLHGRHYGVVLDHRANDLVRNGSSGSLPGYLGAIPIPGVSVAIGAFNFFHHGNNIVVKSGTMFVVFPSDSPRVERCQRSGSH